MMDKILFTGFKGKNNSSATLAERSGGEYLLLTNSFAGLKKDIDQIKEKYGLVIMFGIDKTLSSSVRIEKSAMKDGMKTSSGKDLEKVKESLRSNGIEAKISDNPKNCLCNEAYWHVLQKFSGRAVFIHIPTIKHADEIFIEKMISAEKEIL